MKKDLEDLHLVVNYSVTSYLQGEDMSRYNQEILGIIYNVDELEEREEAGHILANKFLLGEAMNNGWSPAEVFDIEQSFTDLAGAIYDFEKNEMAEAIQQFYHGDVLSESILLLSEVKLFADYRGLGIGARAIKDLYFNFNQGTSLFVVKCFPLQNHENNLDRDKTYIARMQYDAFEKDKKKAFRRLQAYYKKLGFQNIPSIDQEYMFINPIFKNEKFEKISLD